MAHFSRAPKIEVERRFKPAATPSSTPAVQERTCLLVVAVTGGQPGFDIGTAFEPPPRITAGATATSRDMVPEPYRSMCSAEISERIEVLRPMVR